jgi:arylsulfatase A-like enzyme
VGITDYLRPNDSKHLSVDYLTLAELIRRAGYATGMMGKWHLTGYANHGAVEVPPTKHGFDEAIISENRGIAGGSYFYPYHFNREIKKRLPGREYLVDRMNVEAIDFIDRHKGSPFFLYKSHYAVHTRLVGRPDLVAKYEQKPGAGKGSNARRNNPHLAAQLVVIDDGVGMILDKLDQLGISDKTIVIFMSDNGGETRISTNAPLRAGKSTLYEGGIRVPLIIRWPGVVPPGKACQTPVVSMDFYPTLADMLGIRIDPGQVLDGVSLMPILRDPAAKLSRDTLYWHYPLDKPHFLGGVSGGAVRVGDFKLIEEFTTGRLQLFDLGADVGETKDLSADMPEKTRSLHERLKAWRTSVGAKVVKHSSPPKGAAGTPTTEKVALHVAAPRQNKKETP